MRIDACLPVGWGGVPDGHQPLHPAPDATSVWPDKPEAVGEGEAKVHDATLLAKSSIVLRAGRLALASGAGGYRVRRVIDRVGAALGVGCRANVTLMTIDLTVFDDGGSFTEVAVLPNAGVNTERIWRVEGFVDELERYGEGLTITEVHEMLDAIERLPGRYCAAASGVASALACAAFVFCWVAALWKCSVRAWVPELGNGYAASCLARRLTSLPPLWRPLPCRALSILRHSACTSWRCRARQPCTRRDTSVPCSL